MKIWFTDRNQKNESTSSIHINLNSGPIQIDTIYTLGVPLSKDWVIAFLKHAIKMLEENID